MGTRRGRRPGRAPRLVLQPARLPRRLHSARRTSKRDAPDCAHGCLGAFTAPSLSVGRHRPEQSHRRGHRCRQLDPDRSATHRWRHDARHRGPGECHRHRSAQQRCDLYRRGRRRRLENHRRRRELDPAHRRSGISRQRRHRTRSQPSGHRIRGNGRGKLRAGQLLRRGHSEIHRWRCNLGQHSGTVPAR